MSALRITNRSKARALVARVWHRSNPLMSDGGSPWLDDAGAPTSERGHDHVIAPSQSLALDAPGEIALTLFPKGARGPAAFLKPLLRIFGGSEGGEGDSGSEQTLTIDFSLASGNPMGALQVRVFASAAFQFSPLREIYLAPGESANLATGEKGISLRVA
jgi:hypothetical protein